MPHHCCIPIEEIPMKSSPRCFFICMVLLVAARICMAQATVPWLTRSADNSRSGWNPRETQLTQAAVQAKGIIRADIVPIVDDLRVGENAQLHKSAVSSKGVLTY